MGERKRKSERGREGETERNKEREIVNTHTVFDTSVTENHSRQI